MIDKENRKAFWAFVGRTLKGKVKGIVKGIVHRRIRFWIGG